MLNGHIDRVQIVDHDGIILRIFQRPVDQHDRDRADADAKLFSGRVLRNVDDAVDVIARKKRKLAELLLPVKIIAAYEAFITEEKIPHSIYEVEGAKEVAIEFKSYSKTAGFTGIRCAYTIIPKELKVKASNGEEVSLNKMWNRRQCTKFNGVSYVTQRGAEAVYSEEGQKEIRENIKYYLENAKIIREGLDEVGIEYYGGINSPYIWLKVPNNMKSWDFFDLLLEKANVVGTPGVGFGPSGEGYFRLTAFGERKNTEEAMKRIKETLQF